MRKKNDGLTHFFVECLKLDNSVSYPRDNVTERGGVIFLFFFETLQQFSDFFFKKLNIRDGK